MFLSFSLLSSFRSFLCSYLFLSFSHIFSHSDYSLFLCPFYMSCIIYISLTTSLSPPFSPQLFACFVWLFLLTLWYLNRKMYLNSNSWSLLNVCGRCRVRESQVETHYRDEEWLHVTEVHRRLEERTYLPRAITIIKFYVCVHSVSSQWGHCQSY